MSGLPNIPNPRQTSYADAVRRGNALLYLPQELRDEIYQYALDLPRDPPLTVEAASLHNTKKALASLPSLCSISERFCLETLPVVLKHSQIVVRESYTAYSLIYFLETHDMGRYIRNIKFIGHDVPSACHISSRIFKACTNIRNIVIENGQDFYCGYWVTNASTQMNVASLTPEGLHELNELAYSLHMLQDMRASNPKNPINIKFQLPAADLFKKQDWGPNDWIVLGLDRWQDVMMIWVQKQFEALMLRVE